MFNEVRAVEDAMLALYERVERATQYVFSGQSYRELLVWAADKEEGNVDDAEGALRLKQSIAKAAAPARQLLPKSDPLAPKPPSTGRLGPRPLRAIGALRGQRGDAGVFHPTAAVSPATKPAAPEARRGRERGGAADRVTCCSL